MLQQSIEEGISFSGKIRKEGQGEAKSRDGHAPTATSYQYSFWWHIYPQERQPEARGHAKEI